ncbi:hypothetical protein NDU88_007640 [Pleurodeles waltl]|uniref:Uncharacterized protein n=1 Tax=Pleurodeles waltl TaxID=8319 RepID=A0AAV7PN69_PLEWA|nr:hypothetical protein NDU88_007640 [Pleurodeles waltl]
MAHPAQRAAAGVSSLALLSLFRLKFPLHCFKRSLEFATRPRPLVDLFPFVTLSLSDSLKNPGSVNLHRFLPENPYEQKIQLYGKRFQRTCQSGERLIRHSELSLLNGTPAVQCDLACSTAQNGASRRKNLTQCVLGEHNAKGPPVVEMKCRAFIPGAIRLFENVPLM